MKALAVGLAALALGFAARGPVLPSPQAPPPVSAADPVADLRADVDARLDEISAQLAALASRINGPVPPSPGPPPPAPSPSPVPTPPPVPSSDAAVVAATRAVLDADEVGFGALFLLGKPYATTYPGVAKAAKDARAALDKLLVSRVTPLLNADGTWKTDAASVAARQALAEALQTGRYTHPDGRHTP